MILLACLVLGLAVGSAVAFWAVRTILQPVYAMLKLMSGTRQPSGAA